MERSSQSAGTEAISSRSPADALPSSISETHQAVVIARMRDAVLVDVSHGFCALVGRPREELLGRTAADLGISNRDRLDWLSPNISDAARP